MAEDAGSTNGTFVNGVPQRTAALSDRDLIETGHTFFVFREAAAPDPSARPLGEAPSLPELLTFVPELAERYLALSQLAASNVSIILHGETGTGKEVVARATHTLSGRKGAFVAVNCGALPDTLLESELFGHKKGAFSGATEDRPGLVRSSDKGTLFLDEIGDLPAASQSAFLRVLQESEVLPVGGNKPIAVDLRVVAASHKDLPALVEQGLFRGDLFARLSGFTLDLLPLRQRREDMGLLIAALLRTMSEGMAAEVSFSCEAARALFLREWPHNVRELSKCLATACVLAKGGRIEEGQLPAASIGLRRSWPVLPQGPVTLRPPPPESERSFSAPESARPLSTEDTRRREELVGLFREHRGNISAVARATGKGRTQIHRWIERYDIDPAAYREAGS